MGKGGWIYILTNRKNGAIYIGVTSDLRRRVGEHRDKQLPGFTKRYGCDRLVWSDHFDSIEDTIAAEKRMKKWNRAWKVRLIEESNPDWDDLSRFGL
ncbi:MAG: GIY-YIG nuclease family protein [Pacificimonas sp.]|jgi:putative endonuclease|nr:GIY-YIG nuclease family protein [Pacificimonas sp.]